MNPSWGIVTTARAAPRDIARFAAHHLDLGAARIDVYLDGEAPDLAGLSHPALSFHTGTAEGPIHHRQMENAARSYGLGAVDFLAHLDIDEFLLPARPLGPDLAALPGEAAFVQVAVIEALAPLHGPVQEFKRTPAAAGQPRAVLETLYPDYGLHLASGFIGHSHGKAIFRSGQRARPGIHRFRRPLPSARIDGLALAHFHAPSWPAFRAALPARLTNGSYDSARPGQLSMADLLGALRETEGEAGLERFFQVVSTATPEHLDTLDRYGMRVSHDLQLDRKAQKLFPDLPD